MISLLKNWKGKVVVNGKEYDSIASVADSLRFSDKDSISISLYPEGESPIAERTRTQTAHSEEVSSADVRKITVRQYMTEKSSPSFGFMAQWNNDIPMPMRTMVGYKVKETRGMVYMKLHGEAMQTTVCMKCGRPLTNPVSQFFGIGPECGGHNYVHPFDTDEEFQTAFADMQKRMRLIMWEGWIIKSAITDNVPYSEV